MKTSHEKNFTGNKGVGKCTSIVFKSTSEFPFTVGCCTFRAIMRPSFNVALWTWARDAAPSGSGSKLSNSSSGFKTK